MSTKRRGNQSSGGSNNHTGAASTQYQNGSGHNNNHRTSNNKPQQQPQQHKQNDKNLTDTERLPLQQRLADFIASGQTELILDGLSNAHRKYLHKYAARVGLKTVSTGDKSNRVLHITHRKRITSLGAARKLELCPATRRLLVELEPTMHAQISATSRVAMVPPSTQQKASRMRSESLLLDLGPHMVPPRHQFISTELYRDKKDLPIYQYREELYNMLQHHSIFIVNGETGSGKTTQVPQYILKDATRNNRPCRILVTQPRRVAAVSVAHRVAEERGEPLGDTVGYKIRMESRVRKTTNLIYTTSGCLLRSLMADPADLFSKVSHLIIDEIHERDKYSDFTLITLKEQLKLNKELKVILMSATMDIKLLSEYFDDCQVLNVPGQGYDVKIYHLEEILFHTGYRTALMEKFLRSMNNIPHQQLNPLGHAVGTNGSNGLAPAVAAPVVLADEYLQQLLDAILDQCEPGGRSEEELCEIFDQLQYYIESEGMPIDAAHALTGITPLIAACRCNCPKYVHHFMERHANVHIRDAQGYDAVDYARAHTDGACAQILDSSALLMQHKLQLSQEDAEKQRILDAYQQQFNDDSEVDHDLILSLLEGLYRSMHPGAIMVFLPGYNDIVQQRDLIQSTLPPNTYRICILHGQMDSQDQIEALKPQRVRKIILSTNIGQTSITIPDLAYIIDSGKVKMKTYDSITESSQLQTVFISQADASQRSGRAGRTQNGVCYRLYSQQKYEFMPKFCFPEFMRIPLTEICLYAKTLDKTCDVQTYLSRALNPPSSISIQNAVRKLQILQVFNQDESVTELGRHLVEMPLDVQLGKCLLYGIFLKCVDPILTIVAFHSVKDPFMLPTDRAIQGQASFQRKSFAGQSFSDQMGIIALYKAYSALRHNRKRVREFCTKHFLSQSAMEMFCATRRQIADLLSHKFRIGQQATAFNTNWNMVRYCLVAGFYPNVAVIDRFKKALVSGAEKQLILQRTSALNPPGMKNLKDFVDRLPYDWIVFYEKSRVANMCSINMNTVVPPIVIALQCGRDCSLEEEDDSDDYEDEDNIWNPAAAAAATAANSDLEDDDIFNNVDVFTNAATLPKALQNLLLGVSSSLPVTESRARALYALDNWINFELPASDARLLVLVRTLVQTQFVLFLTHGQTAQTNTAAFCLHKLLSSLEDEQSMV